jgi:hypothetical protein
MATALDARLRARLLTSDASFVADLSMYNQINNR